MVLVRMVFQTKWGKIQDVVSEFKESQDMMRRVAGPNVHVRLLTDLSGPFHTLVQEIEVQSLAEWEQIRAKMVSEPEMQQLGADREIPFESGSTEYYTIEASF